MTLIKLAHFLILLSHAEEVQTFKISGENIKFHHYEKTRVTISQPCQSLTESKMCKDIEFLNTISLSKAGLKGTGGINPASVICKKTLNGTVYIGYDKNQNENSFCKINDKLYIDGGTLTYYALKNDRAIFPPDRKSKPQKQK